MKMKHKKILLPTMMLTLTLALTLTGCGNKNGKREGEDKLKLIPENVLNWSGEIDCLVYIEGQDGQYKDIGSGKFTTEDLKDATQARFIIAAEEFNKLAPNIKINMQWCSINNYGNEIIKYFSEKGHYPHILHSVDHVNEVIQQGFAVDLSTYKDTEYYQSYDPSILAEFNFGGFQGAVPYMIFPMGVFVNTGLLDTKYIQYEEDVLGIDSSGEVDFSKWTFENFVDVCKRTTDFANSIAGLSHMSQDFISYAVPSINQNYLLNSEVRLNTPLVQNLIDLEAELAKYTAYECPSGNIRGGMTNIASWSGHTDFIEEDKFVFNADMPWYIGLLSTLATNKGKEDKFDYLPWPRADEDTDLFDGMIAEGLTVGNQCPIVNGVEQCTADERAAQDAAAYFAMFLTADPRSIDARATVDWYLPLESGDELMHGVLDLPMSKKNFRFSFESDDEEYIFYEQLKQWFNCYSTWWYKEEGEEPDVYEYSNMKPGIKKMFEIFYDDKDNGRHRLNYYGVPDNLPSETGGVIDVMEHWYGRYSYNSLVVTNGVPWASTVKAALSTMETEVNTRIDQVYAYFQEMVDQYYGKGKYDVTQ